MGARASWLAGLLLVVVADAAVANGVDPRLPAYSRASGVDGNLSSVGSDTLANLMTLWAEAFKRLYPNVNIQIQATGSSAAAPALTEGTASLGPMSRAMKDDEIEAFERRYGYRPTAIPVAIDAMAVYVHKDNPIKGMTLAQVDAVFSATRRCGYPHDISRWAQLGVGEPVAAQGIQLFGRNSVSGTYGYFKDKALCKGDFKDNVNEQPGSASVVQAVSSSLNGIGYSGAGYRTSGVRTVPLAREAGGEYVDVSPASAASGRYPLARFLYIYVNKRPNKPLPPLEREFIRMVLSRSGQEVVVKDGHVPLTAEVAQGLMEKW